ncbi:DUF2283 domain-containing protein [Infirmifilum lucidum]|uniref:DUF2283 domain-containing protein n=1 Tax=Infirmifilum lucidum TaxID=2776706 RepID=A0A7L9FHP3_9CREN|nr:DUF2283 domain-containing protein [Infirmifilum lucidum]QOJ78882.1 DUF2283 domain-containing protein [Infirmifilum lucidum]
MLKSFYDSFSNTLKIIVSEGKEPSRSLKAGEDIIVHVDEKGEVIAVEFKKPKEVLSALLKSYLEATT